MHLALHDISKKHGAQDHLYPLSLELRPGTINVLLGTTQAGKTSLMRVMAGLDRPSRGQVIADGKDVTGVPVRQRNLAMVYQQFINYPSFTVFENIASPLRIKRVPEAQIRARVTEMAERLHISQHLDKHPAQLSGGQQQRTALARALVKESALLLLDEPLVNLDYKLREELRKELGGLFSEGKTTVVYATTEPLEALQLGGHTILLHEGRLLQHGATLDVFNSPNSILSARTFSDPPVNLIPASVRADGAAQAGPGLAIPLNPAQRQAAGGHADVVLGLRAHSLRLAPTHADDFPIEAEVELAEISGSETYVHLHRGGVALVAQLTGVHQLALGMPCTVYCRPDQLFVFAVDGALLYAPSRPRGE
jgi:glycerol transport system ATP-binding protein